MKDLLLFLLTLVVIFLIGFFGIGRLDPSQISDAAKDEPLPITSPYVDSGYREYLRFVKPRETP